MGTCLHMLDVWKQILVTHTTVFDQGCERTIHMLTIAHHWNSYAYIYISYIPVMSVQLRCDCDVTLNSWLHLLHFLSSHRCLQHRTKMILFDSCPRAVHSWDKFAPTFNRIFVSGDGVHNGDIKGIDLREAVQSNGKWRRRVSEHDAKHQESTELEQFLWKSQGLGPPTECIWYLKSFSRSRNSLAKGTPQQSPPLLVWGVASDFPANWRERSSAGIVLFKLHDSCQRARVCIQCKCRPTI